MSEIYMSEIYNNVRRDVPCSETPLRPPTYGLKHTTVGRVVYMKFRRLHSMTMQLGGGRVKHLSAQGPERYLNIQEEEICNFLIGVSQIGYPSRSSTLIHQQNSVKWLVATFSTAPSKYQSKYHIKSLCHSPWSELWPWTCL